MNKSVLQKFATWAHKELLQQVEQRAFQVGLTKSDKYSKSHDEFNNSKITKQEEIARNKLIEQIHAVGFEKTMEDVAYTWFNRFIALRFLEVNNYLPSHIRIFSDNYGIFKPEILEHPLELELLDLDFKRIEHDLETNQIDSLYRYLLLKQCNALHELLPKLFEKLGDYSELLLPNNVLKSEGILSRLVNDIPESDWRHEVEIIGWLYQYYLTEKHEEVIDPLHGKTIKKEDIPAATQLFTTDWVVRYMVDNTLGRYWMEHSQETQLQEKLHFFMKPKSGHIDHLKQSLNPEKITFFDPCMGSGHILVYAFDVFMEIYKECGYTEKDAASKILQNNLFGLDIDERCSQLAYFALMMKARKYDRRFFLRNISPQIDVIKETNALAKPLLDELITDPRYHGIGEYLLECFKDASEIGSLQNVESLDYLGFCAYLDQNLESISNSKRHKTYALLLIHLAKQAHILSQKYDIVCTNPPYMNKYEGSLKLFVHKNYKDFSGDLFSVFMYRHFDFCALDGYSAFMTPNVWMFLKNYKLLRSFIYEKKHIVSLIQMAKGAFYKEATVDVCAFVLQNGLQKKPSLFLRLEGFKGDMNLQKQKVLEALHNSKCDYYYETDVNQLKTLPEAPLAYWLSKQEVNAFETGIPIKKLAKAKQGLATTNNEKFLRFWFELNIHNIAFNIKNTIDAKKSQFKWFPYNKGGEYNKWFGNLYYVINYENDGQQIKESVLTKYPYLKTPNFVVKNTNLYFQTCMSWSKISSGRIAFRYYPQGFIFDVAGCCLFPQHIEDAYFLFGFLNSIVAEALLRAISPTINYETGHIEALPIIKNQFHCERIQELVKQCIKLSQEDWDCFEISWNFKKHPLL